jgi:hypothetical protein
VTGAGRGASTVMVVLLVALVTVAVVAAGIQIAIQGLPTDAVSLDQTLIAVVAATFAAIGAIILFRLPGHTIGWLCVGIGVVGALTGAWDAHVAYRRELPLTDAPSIATATASDLLAGPLWLALVVFVPLLFPDGRTPRRSWRWLPPALLVVAALTVAAQAVIPGPILDGTETRVVVADNPLGVSALAGIAQSLEGILAGSLVLGVLAGIVALVIRRREPVMRQQIRWVAYALTVAVLGVLTTTVPALETFGSLVASVGFLMFPIAIGMAITRYRLYDLDRIVSRSVSYAVVTVVLVGLYRLSVLGLTALLPTAAGSDLVVAVSTLAVAAAFQPVRRRVQAVVDLRFDRRRYDAAVAVEQFAGRLRDHVSLAPVVSDLQRTVAATVAPRSVQVWLPRGEGT